MVVCVPDFIANAGAVICSSAEYRGGGETLVLSQVLGIIKEKVRRNTKRVLEESAAQMILPREAARRLALARLEAGMSLKRWSIY